MSNAKIAYIDQWSLGTIIGTTEEPAFPFLNAENRRLTSPWRSAYSQTSGGGNFEIGGTVNKLHFDEGSGTITATMTNGTYNAAALAVEIETEMEAAGTHSYSVSYDFSNHKFVIADDTGTVELKGTVSTNAIWNTIGFDAADTGLAASHTADSIRIHTVEYIRSSLDGPASLDFMAVLNHNVQTTGILKVNFSNDGFATTPVSYSPARNGNLAVRLLDAAITYRDRRISIKDVDNPAGFVQVGRCWIGETYTPEIGFSTGITENLKDRSVVKTALSGERSSVVFPHVNTRSYKVDMAHPWASFQQIIDEVGFAKPIIIIMRELSPEVDEWADPENYLFYCTIKKWKQSQLAGEKKSLAITVEEEK